MTLSAKAEYACLAVMDLAERWGRTDKPVHIKDICRRKNIPYKYLTQILPQLKSDGIVRSLRGTSGGYLLEKNPARVTVLEVVEAVDGPFEPSQEGKLGLLPSDPRSVLDNTWRRALEKSREELRRHTFDELASRSAKPVPLSYSI